MHLNEIFGRKILYVLPHNSWRSLWAPQSDKNQKELIGTWNFQEKTECKHSLQAYVTGLLQKVNQPQK